MLKKINALYANRFGDRSKEKMQLLADEGKYCVLYLFLIQSITPITRTHWQANMPQGSERGSLQCPGVASRGICQFSLRPAPGGVLGISSDGDDRMEPKVKTQKNP